MTDGGIPARTVQTADADECSGELSCPICQHRLPVGTPRMPLDSVDGVAADGGHLPVFGARCRRHRDDVYLPAPPAVAPDTYETVDARINGERQTIALPAPVLTGGGRDV